MKINTKKLCELYNKEVSSGKNFTMWFDRKNNDLKFNKELQTRVDELNDMEQLKFLSMVIHLPALTPPVKKNGPGRSAGSPQWSAPIKLSLRPRTAAGGMPGRSA